MGHDDAHRFAGHLEIHVERVTRLAPAVGEAEAPHGKHLAAGEQRVSPWPVVARERQSGNRLHAELLGDVVEAIVDFLQSDRVAAAFGDHLRDALRVFLAVGAPAAVHVVRGDPQNIRTELRVERAPVS